MTLTVTVLIPAHNEAETIGNLINACRRQPYPLVEILVAADSCSDNTAEIARAHGARVIETSLKDKAGAQNAVLPSIHSDVIVGFDGDTVPEPDCISKMMTDISGGLDATCATILPLQAKGFTIRGRRYSYALGRRWWRLCQATVGRMQVLTGAAYAFRSDVIRAIGGFPQGLISADMDATWAMHRDGYKLGYTAAAVALTKEPESMREYRSQIRRWAAGYFQNMSKYKREAMHWRSLLVVATALFDLVSLFWAYGVLGYTLITGNGLWVLKTYAAWVAIHFVVVTGLVISVVGVKEALLGIVPYQVLNFYNKWVYLSTMLREWVLGRHYASWTGRTGRKVEITRMSPSRKVAFTGIVLTVIAAVGTVGLRQPLSAVLAIPSIPLAFWAHRLYLRDGSPLVRHVEITAELAATPHRRHRVEGAEAIPALTLALERSNGRKRRVVGEQTAILSLPARGTTGLAGTRRLNASERGAG